jgi:hypothetical protein
LVEVERKPCLVNNCCGPTFVFGDEDEEDDDDADDDDDDDDDTNVACLNPPVFPIGLAGISVKITAFCFCSLFLLTIGIRDGDELS